MKVFSGLLKLQQSADWHQALKQAVPVRKGFRLLEPEEIERRLEALSLSPAEPTPES